MLYYYNSLVLLDFRTCRPQGQDLGHLYLKCRIKNVSDDIIQYIYILIYLLWLIGWLINKPIKVVHINKNILHVMWEI